MTAGRVRRANPGPVPANTPADVAALAEQIPVPSPLPPIVPFDDLQATVTAPPGRTPVPAGRASASGSGTVDAFWEAVPGRAPASSPSGSAGSGAGKGLRFDGLLGEPMAHAPGHSGLLLTVLDDTEREAALLDRGDMGEGRVGQTLEAARIHGIEVLHGLRVGPGGVPVDHVVISANGVWVVHAVAELAGKLARRDLGNWFTAGARLYIGEADRSDLLDVTRAQVAAVRTVLENSPFEPVEIHGVLCFGMVSPGWVTDPFELEGVTVTWRRYLVEPMLTPVLLGTEERLALTRHFALSVSHH